MRSNAFGTKLLLSIVLTTPITGMAAPAHARQPTDQGDHIPGSVGFTEEELEKRVPPARPEDVASPEAIVKALHDSVSGPKGDWNPDRLRSLCIPSVFFEYNERNKNGAALLSSVSLKNTIKIFKKVHRESGWYEVAVHISAVTIVKNKDFMMASVTYSGGEGKEPNVKISDKPTSVTDLMYIGKRWWVVSHLWSE
jgi:hypothetical protein